MKFLQLCNTLAERDGGPARNAAELHATLRQETNDSCQLWSMALLDTGTIGSAGDKLTQNNMRVYSVRQYGVGRLLKNMRRAQVVVLHGYYLWWIPLAVLAARASRCVVLLTPHGSLTEYQERRSRLRKRFFRVFVSNWMDRLIAQFVVGSEPEAEMLRGSGRRKVSVAGVGTQLPPEDQLAEGAVSDPLELVSVSRIAPKKRIDTMIRSVCELTLRGSGVRLRVAGDGSQELRTELESLARELEVSDRVQFVGQLGDEAKAELFREADLFLLPSDDENFGIGLAEALAHGVPSVVTVAVGASAGMAPDSGRVIARSDPVLVASAVEELAKVADFQVLRASARRDAERLFGWGAVARRWIDIAARSRRPSRGVDE